MAEIDVYSLYKLGNALTPLSLHNFSYVLPVLPTLHASSSITRRLVFSPARHHTIGAEPNGLQPITYEVPNIYMT